MFRARVWAFLGIFLVATGFGIHKASSQSAGPKYKFVTIDIPGSNNTSMIGLNNNGLAAGSTIDANGVSHGLIWANGVSKIINHPNQGPLGLYLYQVNSGGLVAGGYYDKNGISHAVIYNVATKTFKQLPDMPGWTFNAAGGITTYGQTAGNFTTDPTLESGYVAWLYGTGPYLNGYQDFLDANSDQAAYGTITYGMNDALSVVGFYEDSNDVPHGYLKPYGKPAVTIDIPDTTNTVLYAINNFGAIAGRYVVNGARHGVILANSHTYTVDFPARPRPRLVP